MSVTVKVKDYLNSAMLDFSVYKLIQRIPFILDGLPQTQRKIIWTLLNKPKKKYKSLDSFNLIYEFTNYLHGDASAIDTWNNLAADYKNNINILEPKGSFGYRILPQAASPRYTSAILADIAEKIFPKIDFEIRQKQFLEGKEIEPVQLFPVIPIGLINGISGIAVGYSVNILPRDPIFITELLINILEGKINKIPKIIPVKFPYFKGYIKSGENEKQFIIEGLIEKIKKSKKYGILAITEVPYGYDREKMVKILDELEEKGKIISYKENCVKHTFYFEIKVLLELYEKEIEYLINLFKLRIKISETITFINAVEEELHWIIEEDKIALPSLEAQKIKNSIKEYKNIGEYLRDWIKSRLRIYNKRKIYLLEKYKFELKLIQAKIDFINDIINKNIIIEKKSKKNIIDQLQKRNYKLYNDSYDYLIKMPLYSLSEEKIKELNDKKIEIENKINDLQKTEPKQLWLNELKELLPLIKKEIQKKS